jgi:hypothetical protein
MTDTGGVSVTQPATPGPQPAGQPPDLYERLFTALQNLGNGVANLRAVKLYRASSAIVRWVVMVVLIGFVTAALIAFAVSALVSLIPSTG